MEGRPRTRGEPGGGVLPRLGRGVEGLRVVRARRPSTSGTARSSAWTRTRSWPTCRGRARAERGAQPLVGLRGHQEARGAAVASPTTSPAGAMHQQRALTFSAKYPGPRPRAALRGHRGRPGGRAAPRCWRGWASAARRRWPRRRGTGSALAQVYPWGTIRTPTPAANEATAERADGGGDGGDPRARRAVPPAVRLRQALRARAAWAPGPSSSPAAAASSGPAWCGGCWREAPACTSCSGRRRPVAARGRAGPRHRPSRGPRRRRRGAARLRGGPARRRSSTWPRTGPTSTRPTPGGYWPPTSSAARTCWTRPRRRGRRSS